MRIRDNLPVLSAGTTAPGLPHDTLPPAAEDEAQAGLSPAQIVAMLWAYRKLSAIIAVAILVVGMVGIKFLPKTYQATATLMMNNDIKDPLAGKDLTAGPTNAGFIPTEIQLIESPEVLLHVVDQLNLTTVSEFTAGYRGEGDADSLRDWVKDQLLKGLEVSQGSQGSLLINITAAARQPYRAAAIANAIADFYMERQKQRLEKPATDRATRYAEQLAELKAKVTAAQDQATAFRQRTGIMDLYAQKSVESELLEQMQQRLQEQEGARRTGDQGITAAPSDNTDQTLRNQLAAQETQLALLRTTLGPKHPRVVELQVQMDATKRAMAGDTHIGSKNTSAADSEAARQREQKLRDAIATQSAKVLAIRKQQDEGNKLAVELETAQSVYKHALEGYDQIIFASAGNYTYVNVVSRAIAPQKSEKPNKPKLAVMVLMMSILIGLAGPLCYELFIDRRIRCADDMERSFAVPVLVEFETMSTAASTA